MQGNYPVCATNFFGLPASQASPVWWRGVWLSGRAESNGYPYPGLALVLPIRWRHDQIWELVVLVGVVMVQMRLN